MQPWIDLKQIRTRSPLVHNVTNYVVMNTTANALLALGASPVMAHAIEEVEQMVSIASALVLNIGTLSRPWIDSMIKAGRIARQRGIPIILDPVGSGATTFRTEMAALLIAETSPSIIRGNASEILSLTLESAARTKGVDSTIPTTEVIDAAQSLARRAACVVSISGPTDIIVDGSSIARVSNGHPMMPRVTGLGCTSSALTGAFAAVNASRFEAAVNTMIVVGIAGEIAAERSTGPGSLQVNFLDALYQLTEWDITSRMKVLV